MGIPHRVLSEASAAADVAWAAAEMDRLSQPVAILVPPGVFGSRHGAGAAGGVGVKAVLRREVEPQARLFEHLRPDPDPSGGPRAVATSKGLARPTISRFAAIASAVKQLGSEPVIHANGYPARESHAIADRAQNFYMIGSMGLASAIGLGVALSRNASAPSTVVFDGDGNLLMNLGILPMVGARAPERFVHCVFDNEVYGSTGNQDSPAPGVRLDLVAAAAGYRTVAAVTTEDEVAASMVAALATAGPHFILMKVTPEQADVPRIAHTPAQIRDRFRASLAAL
jgi:pyruvate/2-oxoacid:ferredoxin oxidoreductase beta subunit